MFSMCGLICRFVRGWRQNEASAVMMQAAVLDKDSLVTEYRNTSEYDETENMVWFKPRYASKQFKSQPLWRDNNKQCSIISPKECMELDDWNDFSFLDPENGTRPDLKTSSLITVLVEAKYKEKSIESTSSDSILVTQLAKPSAWNLRQSFAIVIQTTPTKLVSMIRAFFTDSLVLDEDLIIYKISTINTSGEPTIFKDTDSIPMKYCSSKLSSEKAKKILTHIMSSHSESEEAETLTPPSSPGIEPSSWSTSDSYPFHSIIHTPKSSWNTTISGNQFHNPIYPRGWAVSGHPSSLTTGPLMGLYAISNQPSCHRDPILNRSTRAKSNMKRNPPRPISPINELGYLTKRSKPRVCFAEDSPPKHIQRSPNISPTLLVGRHGGTGLLADSLNCPTSVFLTKFLSDNGQYIPLCSNKREKHNPRSKLTANTMIRQNLTNIIENYLTKGHTKNALLHALASSNPIPLPDTPSIEGLSNSNDKTSQSMRDGTAEIQLDNDLLTVSIDDNVMDQTINVCNVQNECPLDAENTDQSFSEDSLDEHKRDEKNLDRLYSLTSKNPDYKIPFHKEDTLTENELVFSTEASTLPNSPKSNSPISFEETFSEDSLASSDRNIEDYLPQSPMSFTSNLEARSLVSSPEDFDNEQTCLPSHWRDEYELMFSQFSPDRKPFIDMHCLEPITELDSMSKSSSSTSCDIPYTRYSRDISGIVCPYSDELKQVVMPESLDQAVNNEVDTTCSEQQTFPTDLSQKLLESGLQQACSLTVVDSVVEKISSANFNPCIETLDFSLYPSTKSLLSPVDSITESGFASLKDSSNSETNLDLITGITTSKSKDSLEMAEGSRGNGQFFHAFQLGSHQSKKASFNERYVSPDSLLSMGNDCSYSRDWEYQSPCDDHTAPANITDSKEQTLLVGLDTLEKPPEVSFSQTDSSPSLSSSLSVVQLNNNTKVTDFQPKSSNENVALCDPTVNCEKLEPLRTTESTSIISVESVAVPKNGIKSMTRSETLGNGSCNSQKTDPQQKRSGSMNGSHSSSSETQDQISMKSQDSLDSFTHFNSVRANPKPRCVPRKKVLSVDLDSKSDTKDKVQRSKTLPSDLVNIEEPVKKLRFRKKKKSSSDSTDNKKSSDNVAKKSALESLKGLLKIKTKDKDSQSTKNSQSLFKKLERKARSVSKKDLRDSSSDSIDSSYKTNEEQMSSSTSTSNGKLRTSGNGNTRMGMGVHNILSQNPATSPVRSSSLKKTESPKLYRKVLLRNLSSSQESLEAIENGSNMPVMGTRALKKEKKSFCVTIGFKPLVEESSKTLSEANLNINAPVSQQTGSNLGRRSSSMEILVCGKIKEHGNHRRRTSGKSREGSFRLHRQISVETLFEVPHENYRQYLNRVQIDKSSRPGSAWSLYDNDSSSSHDRPHLRLSKKSSLPCTITDSYCSNPTLFSSFTKGVPASNSFTSHPARKPQSLSANTSPIKRAHNSRTKTSECYTLL